MLSNVDRLRFGCCWYPEQWPRERWAEDLQLMREAGLNCVRVGADAWGLMQPQPEIVDLDFHAGVLDACAEHGLGVIVALPVACMPYWLAQREGAVALEADGQPRRCDGSWVPELAGTVHRAAAETLLRALLGRWAQDERIVAWQLDAAAGSLGHGSRSPVAIEAFRSWLRKRHGSPERLVQAYGWVAQSRQIHAFSEIGPPSVVSEGGDRQHRADWHRFCGDLVAEWVAWQADLLAEHSVRVPTCLAEPDEPVDLPQLAARVEAIGLRPALRRRGGAAPAIAGYAVARARPAARRLWVLEQPSSQASRGVERLPMTAPGELGVAALQSIGQGCNLISWYRWRSHPLAGEVNQGGLLPFWGLPGRHYDEARELITTLAPHDETIARTRTWVTVARLRGWEQSVLTEAEPWVGCHLGDGAIGRAALRELGLAEDRIAPGALLPHDGYQVALLPHAVGITATDVGAMKAWVVSGGVLVVGPLAGHRDETTPLVEPPGVLAGLTGTTNGEGSTWESGLVICGCDGGEQVPVQGPQGGYAEIITPIGDEVRTVARHQSGWLAGKGAVCARNLGQGRVIHVGVPLCNEVLAWLWYELALPKPRRAVSTHEEAAEVLTRQGDGMRLHVALNHGPSPAIFFLYRPVVDLITGQALSSSLTLAGNSWRILREDCDRV